MATTQLISEYLGEVQRVIAEMPAADIERAAEVLYDAWRRGSTVYVVGNGGSAATASHFACDLAKFTIAPGKRRFRVLGLTDNAALVSAWTNDSGFGSIFAEQMEPWVRPGDVLVGLSVHGGSGMGDAGPWSQNLVRAMALAKERGCSVIGLSGFDGGAMRKMADVCLVVPADTEPLGTAVVEAVHVVLHHLICLVLKRRIEASTESAQERP